MDQWKLLVIYVSQFLLMLGVIFLAYYPYVGNVLPDLQGTRPQKPLLTECKVDCDAGFGRELRKQFLWHTSKLKTFYMLFVQIKGENFSFRHSSDDDNLDPHNFVWVENEKEPFLSLDLGYNVYSLTTLSRVVHNMKNTTVPYELQYCLNNSTDDCLTANLAKNFLRDVTEKKGAMCYAVTVREILSYRCCKWDDKSAKKIICDIPVVREYWMTVLLMAMAIAAGVAVLYFPGILRIFPGKTDPEVITPTAQLNPVHKLVITCAQLLYPTGVYWADVIRKLVITLVVFPSLFALHMVILWYVKEYDMPKMFTSHDVSDKWKAQQRYPMGLRDAIGWLLLAFFVSFLPDTDTLEISSAAPDYQAGASFFKSVLEKKRTSRKRWSIPFTLTRNLLQKAFSIAATAYSTKSYARFIIFLPVFLLTVIIAPGLCILLLVGYFLHASPLGEATTLFFFNFCVLCNWVAYYISNHRHKRVQHSAGFICLILCCAVFGYGVYGMSEIISISLILLTKLIAYTLMGIVLSAEYYSSRLLFAFTFSFYLWHCFCVVTAKYQKLLKLTFQQCNDPEFKSIITRNKKGVKCIPTKLFQRVCDEIFPRHEAYSNMALKLAAITLFLCLTFSSIMIFSKKSSLSTLMTAVFSLITGIIPKLAMFISQGSSAEELHDFAWEAEVEKAVRGYVRDLQNAKKNASGKRLGQADTDGAENAECIEMANMKPYTKGRKELNYETCV